MKISSLSYAKQLITSHGLTYVMTNGSQYVFDYLKHMVLTSFYLQQLQALPTTMPVKAIMNFVYHSSNQVFKPLQYESELEAFLKVVRKTKPKCVVEIGTANGGTLLSMIKVSPSDTKFVSIDLPAGAFGGGYAWYKIPLFKAFVSGKQEIHLLRLDSHSLDTVAQLKQILAGQLIDFLMIDGDHTYEGVKQDFELYSPLVKKGGKIAFHDIVPHRKELNTQVDKFWNKISKKYPSQTLVENWDQGMCGIGILTKK